jgi:chromosomal replication initiation ATPase DnaA
MPMRQELTAGEAWERVIQHLQQNRILPVLLDRLLDAEIQFADQTFRVVVEDPQVRAMLEDRLSSTINRLLAGLCSGETSVQFVQFRKVK